MKTSEGIEHFYNYQRLNVKKNTIRNYEFILDNFHNHFGDIELLSITPEDILAFMPCHVQGIRRNQTKYKKIKICPSGCFSQFHQKMVD